MMTIVFKKDKQEYFEVLIATREQDDIGIFRSFMASQYHEHLTEEIDRYKKALTPPKSGRGYSFIF